MATGLVILLKLDSNHQLFGPYDPKMDELKNNRAHFLCNLKLCATFQSHQWIQTQVTVRKYQFGIKIGDFFAPCDLEIWQVILQNSRAPLLFYAKLYASFCSHQTRVAVRKPPIWVKIINFLLCVTLKFDGWPWKTTRHHVIAIGEFKLKLQSGNAQSE